MNFKSILTFGVGVPIGVLGTLMCVLKRVLSKTAKQYKQIADGRQADFQTKKLKILDFNAFWRPQLLHLFKEEYMRDRSKILLERISEYDVVCLQEGFQFGSDISKNFIEAANALGFKYVLTSKLPPLLNHQVIDSGLVIISKFPILESDCVRYTAGCGFDAFAAKGALYAKIQLDEKNHVHLFSTHLQASYQYGKDPTDVDVKVRQSQFDELSALMAQKVTDGYPAIVVGDLNVNARFGDEYLNLLKHFTIPNYESVDTLLKDYGEHPITFGNMEDVTLTEPYFQKTVQSIDYIFLFEKEQSPLKVEYKSKVNEMRVQNQPYGFLSDHFAVESEFTFTQ
ncbi:Endonuclease/Exonuclease/phosphatase family protein [Trichomonas vaginalis G3]|uniref:sphingomyelin phosphodiesterase n=1 Tax=Trichomonas vaginalis (strain ATCC PRA-98 / G3) TaxID=412133 RepID=A2EE69_TRIV3|nr:endonuclease/exonuclease/phosphatase family [Trichomonas vaginalis G3]EAY09066.1 Endonuclease/Exonuclease/phosphatase family protein [Trichomonas vaginalis G3]KAI5503418.1 endonuclease/exonuclease/phosphatase family [Trichomonas vaginalis G3]|eukprot:XP_001321289.1 Endonuclease/Exonuclease/phosphatase family protein [Trichomonas vaginalis G3]